MMNNKPDVASEEMERQVRREIAKQEANRSAVTDWMALDADGSTLVTRYFDDLPLLKRLEAIAQSVAKGREQPCKVVAGHDGVEVLRTTRTGTPPRFQPMDKNDGGCLEPLAPGASV
jgi:hypothetical protein